MTIFISKTINKGLGTRHLLILLFLPYLERFQCYCISLVLSFLTWSRDKHFIVWRLAPSNILSPGIVQQPKRYISQAKNPCWFETKADKTILYCIPYFYVAGVAKCGTSDLYRRIRLHPDVMRGTMKEYHWWDRSRFDDPEMNRGNDSDKWLHFRNELLSPWVAASKRVVAPPGTWPSSRLKDVFLGLL